MRVRSRTDHAALSSALRHDSLPAPKARPSSPARGPPTPAHPRGQASALRSLTSDI